MATCVARAARPLPRKCALELAQALLTVRASGRAPEIERTPESVNIVGWVLAPVAAAASVPAVAAEGGDGALGGAAGLGPSRAASVDDIDQVGLSNGWVLGRESEKVFTCLSHHMQGYRPREGELQQSQANLRRFPGGHPEAIDRCYTAVQPSRRTSRCCCARCARRAFENSMLSKLARKTLRVLLLAGCQ